MSYIPHLVFQTGGPTAQGQRQSDLHVAGLAILKAGHQIPIAHDNVKNTVHHAAFVRSVADAVNGQGGGPFAISKAKA